MYLDNNIILIPISMLMMNITGPLIQKRMPKPIFEFLELPIFAPFLFMFLFYVATRKFAVSLGLGIFIYILMITIFNDKSVFYILPKRKEEPPAEVPDLKGELALGKVALGRRNAMLEHYNKKQMNIDKYQKLMDTINTNEQTNLINTALTNNFSLGSVGF
jgi:hypothetical protein